MNNPNTDTNTDIINLNTHLLKNALFIASPNYDERPLNEQPSLIVIHGISLPPKQFGGKGVEQFFTNQLDPSEHSYYQKIKDLKVSAHLFIRRDGDVIQFVPFNKRAWHAGISNFKGRKSCNDFSIGIELEGTDNIAYTEKQYIQLAKIVKVLRSTYLTIKPENIVGHCDIAPERKTDPGKSFSWKKLNEIFA